MFLYTSKHALELFPSSENIFQVLKLRVFYSLLQLLLSFTGFEPVDSEDSVCQSDESIFNKKLVSCQNAQQASKMFH